jgi:hypothetical protein
MFLQGYHKQIQYTGYFTSDNEPDGIKNATHNTFSKEPDILISVASFFRKCSVGCIFNSVGLIITREIPCIQIYQ